MKLSLIGCEFSDNSAGSFGTIFLADALATLQQCVFSRNTANQGAALYLSAGSAISLSENSFTENNATRGGAIFAVQSTVMSAKTMCARNRARESGGCLLLDQSTASSLQDLFDGNMAGGAVRVRRVTVSAAESHLASSAFVASLPPVNTAIVRTDRERLKGVMTMSQQVAAGDDDEEEVASSMLVVSGGAIKADVSVVR